MKSLLKMMLIIVSVMLLLYAIVPGVQAQRLTIPQQKTLSERVLMPDLKYDSIYYDDFVIFNTAITDTLSLNTAAGTTTAILDSLTGGIMKISPGASAEDDGMNISGKFATFKVVHSPGNPDSAGVELIYEVSFMVTEEDECMINAGLGIEDNEWHTGSIQDAIYFLKPDGTDSLYIASDKGGVGTFTYSGMPIVPLTWYRMKIVWNGRTARFFVNEQFKGYIVTVAQLPVVNVKPTFEYAAGSIGVFHCYLDYMLAKQAR